MQDFSNSNAPWNLGYYRFDAYEFGWLISGSLRYAYLSLSSGGVLELPVRLTPAQGRVFIKRERVRYQTEISPTRTWKTEARPLQVCFDVLPPKRGNMRYADRTNAYAAAKRAARCKSWQGQAREGLEHLRRRFQEAPRFPHAGLELERIAGYLHSAWLEAWGYLPWMAGTDERSLLFAAEAFGPPTQSRHQPSSEERVRQWHSLLGKWTHTSETPEQMLGRLEALASWVNRSVRRAEEEGWPELDFSGKPEPRFR